MFGQYFLSYTVATRRTRRMKATIERKTIDTTKIHKTKKYSNTSKY